MKKILTSVCGGAALLVLLTGCDPQMAQIESGTQEAVWYGQLKENYASFRPPQYPAPAIYNRNASAPAMERGRAVAPADDPEKAVDRAAEGENNVQVLNDEKKQDANAPVAQEQNAADKTAPAGADANVQKKDDKQPAPGVDAAEGKLYVVKSGDTLGSIAQKFYGRASMSDVIYRANGKVIKDRNRLQIGMRLVIPEL